MGDVNDVKALLLTCKAVPRLDLGSVAAWMVRHVPPEKALRWAVTRRDSDAVEEVLRIAPHLASSATISVPREKCWMCGKDVKMGLHLLPPFHLACFWGQLRTVAAFLRYDKDLCVDAESPCPYGHIPLHLAAQNGHVEVANLLIRHGADVNAFNLFGFGCTALYTASSKGHADVAECLILNGADVDLSNVSNV